MGNGTIKPALEALGRLSWDQDDILMLSHPTLADGITAEEAKILTVLSRIRRSNPSLVDTLLDPDQTTLEQRTISMPLGGEVHITIIRTRPGAQHTMDLLESSMRFVEEFMAVPFPRRQAIYFFTDDLAPSGVNPGTHVVMRSSFDNEPFQRLFVHEIAHYYWRGNIDWIDEGAATLLMFIPEHESTGQPIPLSSAPCPFARNIAEFENLTFEGNPPAISCEQRLGGQMFFHLYEAMGEIAFRQRFRDLYLKSQADSPDDDCEGAKLHICHVKAAFQSPVGTEASETASQVIEHWYTGSDPQDLDSLRHIQGVVVGPDGSPLQGIHLWAWQGKAASSRVTTTGADGAFDLLVPDGSYTMNVHISGPGCNFVGRYDGSGGITTIRSQAFRFIVDGSNFRDIQIRLMEHPDELPRIEHCS